LHQNSSVTFFQESCSISIKFPVTSGDIRMIFISHIRPGDLVVYFQVTTKYFLVSVRGGM